MGDRGVIRNLKFARQRADFSGLRFGTITPTDIDGLIEFENRCCVFMETKHGDADLPTGQRLALERNCDRWGAAGIVLVMRNADTGNGSPTYDIATLPVVEYRHAGQWKPSSGGTCCQWIVRFASKTLGRPIEGPRESVVDPLPSAPANAIETTPKGVGGDVMQGFGIDAYSW